MCPEKNWTVWLDISQSEGWAHNQGDALENSKKGFQGIALTDKKNECCTCFWGEEVQRTVSDDGMIWTDIFDHSLKTSWVTCVFVHITFYLPVWSFVILVVTLKIIFDLAGIMWWLYGKSKTLWKWSRSYFLGNQWTYLSSGVKKLSIITTRNQVLPSHVFSLH